MIHKGKQRMKPVMSIKDIIPVFQNKEISKNAYWITIPNIDPNDFTFKFLAARSVELKKIGPEILKNAYWVNKEAIVSWKPFYEPTDVKHIGVNSVHSALYKPGINDDLIIHSLLESDKTYLALMGFKFKKIIDKGFVFKLLRAIRLNKMSYPYTHQNRVIKVRSKC